MAQPTTYTRQQNFTNWLTNNPNDDARGPDLDAEFNAIKTTLDETLANLAIIQRDDTELANDTVHPDSLDDATLALIAGDWLPRGDWATATEYAVSDLVVNSSITYLCVEAHTSGTFSTDLAANKWMSLGASIAAGLSFTPAAGLTSTTVQSAIAEGYRRLRGRMELQYREMIRRTSDIGIPSHNHTVSNITDAGTAASLDTGTAAGELPTNADLNTSRLRNAARLALYNLAA